jgi:hypothetical protein
MTAADPAVSAFAGWDEGCTFVRGWLQLDILAHSELGRKRRDAVGAAVCIGWAFTYPSWFTLCHLMLAIVQLSLAHHGVLGAGRRMSGEAPTWRDPVRGQHHGVRGAAGGGEGEGGKGAEVGAVVRGVGGGSSSSSSSSSSGAYERGDLIDAEKAFRAIQAFTLLLLAVQYAFALELRAHWMPSAAGDDVLRTFGLSARSRLFGSWGWHLAGQLALAWLLTLCRQLPPAVAAAGAATAALGGEPAVAAVAAATGGESEAPVGRSALEEALVATDHQHGTAAGLLAAVVPTRALGMQLQSAVYGTGRVLEVRSDGAAVLQLPYGTAFLSAGDTAKCTVTPEFSSAAKVAGVATAVERAAAPAQNAQQQALVPARAAAVESEAGRTGGGAGGSEDEAANDEKGTAAGHAARPALVAVGNGRDVALEIRDEGGGEKQEGEEEEEEEEEKAGVEEGGEGGAVAADAQMDLDSASRGRSWSGREGLGRARSTARQGAASALRRLATLRAGAIARVRPYFDELVILVLFGVVLTAEPTILNIIRLLATAAFALHGELHWRHRWCRELVCFSGLITVRTPARYSLMTGAYSFFYVLTHASSTCCPNQQVTSFVANLLAQDFFSDDAKRGLETFGIKLEKEQPGAAGGAAGAGGARRSPCGTPQTSASTSSCGS